MYEDELNTLRSEKDDLRKKMRLFLKETADSLKEKNEMILERLMKVDACRHAWLSERMMSYVSMPLEVDTRPLFAEKSMIVPCCEEGEIVPIRILSWNELETTESLNILEPKKIIRQEISRRVLLEQIDVVLVPGLAFDYDGNRLGRGRGYYDRFLRHLSPSVLTIGLALEGMIGDTIPHCESDWPVNKVVTERRTLNFKKNKRQP